MCIAALLPASRCTCCCAAWAAEPSAPLCRWKRQRDRFDAHFDQSPGIGLTLVKQLVHRNRGSVGYARAVAGGARFVLTF